MVSLLFLVCAVADDVAVVAVAVVDVDLCIVGVVAACCCWRCYC